MQQRASWLMEDVSLICIKFLDLNSSYLHMSNSQLHAPAGIRGTDGEPFSLEATAHHGANKCISRVACLADSGDECHLQFDTAWQCCHGQDPCSTHRPCASHG